MRRAISWNVARLEELRTAFNTAVAARNRLFTVKIAEQGTHEFDVTLARDTITWLEKEFAANPPVVVSPNREGKEGE